MHRLISIITSACRWWSACASHSTLSSADAASLPIVASAAYTLLFKAGHLVTGQKVFILGAAGSVGLLAVQFDVSAAFIFTQTDKPVMEKVAEMAGKGIIRINIGKTLPLAEASQAHTLIDGGTISGKIILEMN
jgi:NADPH:quinone reductase-like Zn-dependent oxidoreductase